MLLRDVLVRLLELAPVALLAGLAVSAYLRGGRGSTLSIGLAITLALLALLTLVTPLPRVVTFTAAPTARAVLEMALAICGLALGLSARGWLDRIVHGVDAAWAGGVAGLVVGTALAGLSPAVARASAGLILMAAIVVLTWPAKPAGRHPFRLAGLALPLLVIAADELIDPLAAAYAFAASGLLLFGGLSFDHVAARLRNARAAVIEAMTDAVVTVDDDGEIVDLNAAARTQFGRGQKSVLRHRMEDLFPDSPALRQIAASTAPAQREIGLAGGNEARTFEVRSFPLDATAAGTGKCLLLRDITRQKQLESEMLHQETALAMLKERGRLGQEFHDGLAQDLVALRMKLCQWEDVADPRVRASLPGMIELVSEDIREIRRAIMALRPLPLAEAEFFSALRQHIDDFAAISNIRVELKVQGTPETLPTHLEPALFRVIQEALHNVAKHAQAQSVKIGLDLRNAESVALTINDDGVGFDPAELEPGKNGAHLGLRQMSERVQALCGSMTVRSEPGLGTDLTVVLPKR